MIKQQENSICLKISSSSFNKNENISVNVGDISYLITYDISVINSLYVSGDISIRI